MNPVYTKEDFNHVLRNMPQAEPFGAHSRKRRQHWSFWPPTLPQPGKHDELQKESREVMGAASEFVDGVKIDFSKGLSENLSCLHSLAMSNDQNTQKYSFQVQGVPSPTTMVYGRIDSDYNVMGKWQQNLSSRCQVRFSGQASREAHNSGGGIEVDYSGNDWFGQFMWNNPGLYRATYCQSLTRRLVAGGELAYNHKQAVSMGTMGLRYFIRGGGIVSVLAAIPTLQFSYFHEVNPRCDVAVEYLVSAAQGLESKLDLAYCLRFQDFEFRAHMDSQYHGHASFSTQLTEMGPMFTLFGDFDYKKKKFGIGLGLNLQV